MSDDDNEKPSSSSVQTQPSDHFYALHTAYNFYVDKMRKKCLAEPFMSEETLQHLHGKTAEEAMKLFGKFDKNNRVHPDDKNYRQFRNHLENMINVRYEELRKSVRTWAQIKENEEMYELRLRMLRARAEREMDMCELKSKLMHKIMDEPKKPVDCCALI